MRVHKDMPVIKQLIQEGIPYEKKIKAGFDVDVIVRDRAYSDEMKNFPGNIMNAAFQTGVVV